MNEKETDEKSFHSMKLICAIRLPILCRTIHTTIECFMQLVSIAIFARNQCEKASGRSNSVHGYHYQFHDHIVTNSLAVARAPHHSVQI